MNDNLQPRLPAGVARGENIIFSHSWLNQPFLILLFLALEAGMIYLSILFPESTSFPLHIGASTLKASYLPALPLVVLGKAAIQVYNERLVATPDYLIHVTGRISWSERSVRLEYQHIQEIETVQTIYQRIVGLGDLVITPIGGGNRPSVHMEGLRHPRVVKDMIREIKSKGSPSPGIH